MKSQNKYLKDEFEKIVWSYLDKDLSADQMKYWEEKIEANPELKTIIKEIREVEDFYNSEAFEDVDENVFNSAINKATEEPAKLSVSKILNRIVFWFSDELNTNYKLAFGSILIILSVVFFLNSKNSNPVKEIKNELFSWEGEKIGEQISQIDNDLYLMQNKQVREQISQRISNDPWDNEIYKIKARLTKLENEIKGNN